MKPEIARSLQRSRVLIELGWFDEADAEATRLAMAEPDNSDVISLVGKLAHVTGRLSQAIACWAQVRARTEPRPPLKAALLHEACVAVRSGDLDGARVVLERMGQERGFELDLDRLMTLAYVYERIGTPQARERAKRVSRHVIADTRRRMHRPSLRDLVEVAALEYMPLAELRKVRVPDEEIAELPRRARAIAHALRHENRTACMLFADGGEILDRQYLAELAALAGDEDRAVELALGTLPDGANPFVVGWLLDRRRVTTNLVAYRAMLERALERAPYRAESARHLAQLHELAGDHMAALQLHARAAALSRAHEDRELPIGRVLAAGVCHFDDTPVGLIHEVWVHREPTAPGRGGTLAADDIHGNLTHELRAAIRNTFVAVREYARAKFPHATVDIADWTYSYKLPKEDEPSAGLSAGLPTALAFLSTFLQRPVPRTIASSGVLISESHDVMAIGRIGEAEFKVLAACHGNLHSLILPTANRGDLEISSIVPHALTHELVQYAADLDHAVRLVFGEDAFTRL